MENAVQALKMAFGVIIFVLGLSLSMYAFSETRTVSEDILYAKDETNYYEYMSAKDKNENREVGLETIIPTLYKYYKENYTVVFKQASFDEKGNIVGDVKPLFVYESKSKFTSTGDNNGVPLWGDYNWAKYGIGYNEKQKICAFDLDDEIKRKESWVTGDEAKKNIDAFLYGGTYRSNTGAQGRDIEYFGSNSALINSSGANERSAKGDGFIKLYKDKKFVEYLGEYVYNQKNKGAEIGTDDYITVESSTTEEINGETVTSLKDKKKRVITYILKT